MLFLGRTVEGFWSFGLEKPLSAWSLVSYSVGTWRNADGGGLACEVSEGSLRIPQRHYLGPLL